MRQTISFIFLIYLLLLVTSCTNQTTTLHQNYKTGVSNVVLTTLTNQPPDIVYPNTDFKIVVKVDNQGAYPLTKGSVKILGFNDKYIILTEPKKSIVSLTGDYRLEGKSSTNPSGEFTFLEFDATAKNLLFNAENYANPYFIKTEYAYKTEFSQTVCLNTNLYDVQDAGCKVTPKASFSGQGAPLAITELEEIVSPGPLANVEFRLNLKNLGKGKIREVKLERASLGNQPLKCIFNNNPGLKKDLFEFKENKEVTIICKKNKEDQKSYSTLLYLELSYDYVLEESKTLTIKK